MQNNLQETIQALLNRLVAEGKERGVQVAVYIDGRLAVDAWAGVADVRTGRVVEGDSLFPVFSCTKGIYSTVLHILAERGKLDYDAPIARYWPEFAANGKERITTRHVLSHMAGLPFMPDGVDLAQINDWDFMCAKVAQLEPAWPAATQQIYHPITFGWLVGEVARRVDARSVPRLLAEEICRPLGITTMFCGIPAELEPATAFLEMIPNPPVVVPPPPHGAAPCMMPLHEWMNRADSRRAPQPGCTGIMNARAIARTYAALLPGGVDGVELLPPARVRLATERQVPLPGYEPDPGWHRGLGYMMGLGEMGKDVATFGHDGHGGSIGFAAPECGVAVGVTRNLFSDFKVVPLVSHEIRSTFGI